MRLPTATRDRLAADLVRAGRSVAETALELGCCTRTVRSALQRMGVMPQAVRRPDDDWAYGVPTLDDPAWAGLCWYRRCTKHPCREVATWQSGQCMACDEHRAALCCNVSVRRVRREDAEAWLA